jgi:hypothetical protein
VLCCSQVSFVAPSFTYLGVESILVPFKQFVDICFCSIPSCSFRVTDCHVMRCAYVFMCCYVIVCCCDVRLFLGWLLNRKAIYYVLRQVVEP